MNVPNPKLVVSITALTVVVPAALIVGKQLQTLHLFTKKRRNGSKAKWRRKRGKGLRRRPSAAVVVGEAGVWEWADGLSDGGGRHNMAPIMTSTA